MSTKDARDLRAVVLASQCQFKRTRYASTNISALAFRMRNYQTTQTPCDMVGTLFVRFTSGALYAYYDVPVSLYRATLYSRHPGATLNTLVKARGYDYALLDAA